MRAYVTYAGEGHWLTVMFGLTLMTILFQANVSTADLSSDPEIASFCVDPVILEKNNDAFICRLNADQKNITKGVKLVQKNPQTHGNNNETCNTHFFYKLDYLYRRHVYGKINNSDVLKHLLDFVISHYSTITSELTVSSCRIPEVKVGDNATITCRFNNDLSKTKQGGKVVQYNSKKIDKTVLACLWHFDEPNCIEKYGFKLYGEISNELRLNIPRVTKEHAGTYACIVFDSEPGTQNTCVLTVVDNEREMFPLLLPMLKTVCVLATFIIMLLIAVIVIMCKGNASL